LKRGDVRVRTWGNLTALVWKDRWDIYILTWTHHQQKGIFAKTNALWSLTSWQGIQHMGYIDNSDHMANSYSVCRHCYKWTVLPRIMWGVANPKLVSQPPDNTIVPYSHSAVLRVPGCKWVWPHYAKLCQQTSLLGIRAGLTATRNLVCSGSRNTIYKSREMWVDRTDRVLLEESMLVDS
jgi:hypothetical protein